MENKLIGKRIKELRMLRGYTQEHFAELLGISTNHVSVLERGVQVPSLETLVRMANVLNISADELLIDVVHAARDIKYSTLSEMMKNFSADEYRIVTDVVEVLIKDLSDIKNLRENEDDSWSLFV